MFPFGRSFTRELSAHGVAEPALDPWNAILNAEGTSRGLFLSAADVGRLVGDDAIQRVALNFAMEAEGA